MSRQQSRNLSTQNGNAGPWYNCITCVNHDTRVTWTITDLVLIDIGFRRVVFNLFKNRKPKAKDVRRVTRGLRYKAPLTAAMI